MKGFPKVHRKVTNEELKDVQLNILFDIDKFCRDNNYKYWIAAGTLIGAIRHKGFIPWDDDIDLYMPRPDYERFIREYKPQSDNYELFYPGRKGYFIPIAKVADLRTVLVQDVPINDRSPYLGVHVDVLPLDGEPDNINDFVYHVLEIIKTLDCSRFFRTIMGNKLKLLNPRTFLHWLYYRIILSLSLERSVKKVDELCRQYFYEDSKYIGYIAVAPYKFKERYEKKWFEGEDVVVEFEGHTFPAPSGWHEYLTHVYGDYMQLPPLDKRKCEQHIWTAYWIKD